MERIFLYPVVAAVMAMASMACVREDIPECPPLKISIVVKDKNYFNVDKVEQEESLAGNLPFSAYVPTLMWTLREYESGKVVARSPLSAVDGEGQAVVPDIDSRLPHGRYIFTAWGGLSSENAVDSNHDNISFHPGNAEGDDVYLTNDTILYDAWHDTYTVEMERTKGKLIIEKVNLPSNIAGSSKHIDGVYASLGRDFRYSGQTFVAKQIAFESSPKVVSKTLLTPSVARNATKVKLDFISGEGSAEEPLLSADAVSISINRNELTVLRYEWDEARGAFKIYILINDSWDLLNHLVIE